MAYPVKPNTVTVEIRRAGGAGRTRTRGGGYTIQPVEDETASPVTARKVTEQKPTLTTEGAGPATVEVITLVCPRGTDIRQGDLATIVEEGKTYTVGPVTSFPRSVQAVLDHAG